MSVLKVAFSTSFALVLSFVATREHVSALIGSPVDRSVQLDEKRQPIKKKMTFKNLECKTSTYFTANMLTCCTPRYPLTGQFRSNSSSLFSALVRPNLQLKLVCCYRIKFVPSFRNTIGKGDAWQCLLVKRRFRFVMSTFRM